MNRLLKYALPSALGLMLAAPAMAQNGSNNGQSWNNSPQAQNWQGQNGWQGNQSNANNGQNGYQRYGENGNWNGNQRYGQNGYQNYSQNNNQGAANLEVTEPFMARIQRSLQQRGFYHQGNVDGVWGPETSDALANFQRRNDLPPTGQLDVATLEALNVLNSSQNGYQNGYQTYNRGNRNQGENYSSNSGWNGNNPSNGGNPNR